MSSINDISHEGISELLSQRGLCGQYQLLPLKGGRNNKAFKLKMGMDEYFLKSYFFSYEDQRDRLYHEFSFTNFAWSNGIHSVPEPLAKLPGRRMALYEFIKGKIANYRETTDKDICQAIDFIVSLNRCRRRDLAVKLPPASEACFSVKDHVKSTALRVNRLLQIESIDDYSDAARKQINQRLLPLWDEVIKNIEEQRGKNPLLDEILSAEQRWISPSDFGFHNAIEEENGEIRFIDFEYAGWDDPAKLLCDFANQPDRILKSSLSLKFIRNIIAADVNPEFLKYRYALLEPLYQIKWACIILNDFLPNSDMRRRFTLVADNDENKRSQLEKLDMMLHRADRTIKSNKHYLN